MEQRHTNHLIHETSPYLLQHAHNPVDWYAWGEEALAKAKTEDKPILLSIGYSACHWCHVMEHESFENERIAELMNAHFVNIKVDREERPDLDQIYQYVVQMFGVGGGWPLTMFLTPDKEPFYGGTYFPPDDRFGRPGFTKVLEAAARYYREHKAEIRQTTQRVVQGLENLSTFRESALPLTKAVIENAVRKLNNIFDEANGGFGTQPKFPNPMNLALFLRYWRATGNEPYLRMALLALQKMAQGGIYDQLGGGFHRYSVDAHWLVPHFEKMLYDNAQLIRLYADAYRITKDPFYQRVVKQTVGYVQREMLQPGGGFYATQDADSEGEEGKFFVWSPDEIAALVGAEVGEIFCRAYGVEPQGNFEHGKSILHRAVTPEWVAHEFGEKAATIERLLAEARDKLFAAREHRIKPFRDEKVIVSWNGLMISALLDAANLLGDETVKQDAVRSIEFILTHLVRDGRLLHSFKDGQAKLAGYLDDHACFVAGLLDAFESTAEARYLTLAEEFNRATLANFWDEERGGFFLTGPDHEALIHRPKDPFDHAVPGGNSVATLNLLRLYYYTGEQELVQKAEQTLRLFRDKMEDEPFSFGQMLCALDFYLETPREIAIIGRGDQADTQSLLRLVHESYIPNKVLLVIDPVLGPGDGFAHLPVGEMTQLEGKATAYVCHNFACSVPTTTSEALAELLK
ncbi:MAG TPA: thioredoxin domain-containing protein [Candidatus Tectomicrobia bacterium]|nr:thioredoxin domain-containing protein [Candidatus Tectomicrobia bacterium]